MKAFLFLPIALCFLHASCGNGSEKPPVSADTVSDTSHTSDAVVTHPDTLPAALIASGMEGDVIAPSDADLVFFRFRKELDANTHKVLTAREVRSRFTPVDPECDEEAAWTFQRFFYLDSLHRLGEEPETDMGQTVKVEIREYDTIKNTPLETWVVWTMFYETSQACPYATGTYYMLSTYDAGGKLVSTQCMGRNCGGADAPLQWVSVQESNIFTDGSFRGLLCDTSGEDDFRAAKDLSIMRRTFTGRIAPGGKVTTEVKEIERND